MALSLHDITTFLTIYETGGVNAAARRLDLSRSIISSRLSSLEDELGTQLFVRSTKAMTPTDAGTLFYQRTSILVQNLEDAVDDVRPEESGLCGTFRIAAPVSLTLSYLQSPINEFTRQHTDLRVSVDLDDNMVDLASGLYDVAIRIGRLSDSSLKARKLADSRRILSAAPSYLAERGVPKTLDELSDHDAIGYANQPISHEWEFKDAKDQGWKPVKMSPRFVSNNGETMREAILSGLGLCVLPEFLIADQLRSGELVPVLEDYELTMDGIYAVYLPGREHSKKIRAFIDHLVEFFGSDLPWERASDDS